MTKRKKSKRQKSKTQVESLSSSSSTTTTTHDHDAPSPPPLKVQAPSTGKRRRDDVSAAAADSSTTKSSKKQKKDKTTTSASITTTTTNNDDEYKASSSSPAAAVDKKKKSKKKKRKKKKKSTENSSTFEREETNASETTTTTTPLEGCMVEGQMVLIERTLGKVYSSTERLENGDYREIGTVQAADGKVILNSKQLPDDDEDDDDDFPFGTDPDDHCESPLEAYQDIVPFLKKAQQDIAPSSQQLSIYDPYYCNGRVVKQLESLGFPNVYNRKEDCYQVWASSAEDDDDDHRYPSFDILITNPPYSGDHIERLIRHITTSPNFNSRPWMLLLPQWVHKKDYYIRLTKHIQPFYVVPHKRYVYLPPPLFRQAKKSDVHKKSSPFVSMWYLWGGTPHANDEWFHKIASSRQGLVAQNCDVARSRSALRDLRRKRTNKK